MKTKYHFRTIIKHARTITYNYCIQLKHFNVVSKCKYSFKWSNDQVINIYTNTGYNYNLKIFL